MTASLTDIDYSDHVVLGNGVGGDIGDVLHNKVHPGRARLHAFSAWAATQIDQLDLSPS